MCHRIKYVKKSLLSQQFWSVLSAMIPTIYICEYFEENKEVIFFLSKVLFRVLQNASSKFFFYLSNRFKTDYDRYVVNREIFMRLNCDA
jgi:hypothetical protein